MEVLTKPMSTDISSYYYPILSNICSSRCEIDSSNQIFVHLSASNKVIGVNIYNPETVLPKDFNIKCKHDRNMTIITFVDTDTIQESLDYCTIDMPLDNYAKGIQFYKNDKQQIIQILYYQW